MASEEDKLPPIESQHERWEPSPIPANIEIPGLDTSASVQDQIEQIEQLITIKLQNIDANFARAHQILSTRILPAVKRYAVNTEPVRDAARFWVSFYEQAAQVRIPTTEDFSADHEQQAMPSDEEAEAAVEEEAEVDHPQEKRSRSVTFDPNVTPAESSFAPEKAAVSSTPMPQSNTAQTEADAAHEMWAQSMQSPLKRLNEGLKSLREDEDSIFENSKQMSNVAQQSVHSDASSTRPAVFTKQDKGKRPRVSRVFRRDEGKEKPASPVKSKKTPKKNPYVPSDVRRGDWDGIVDLANPATPRAGRKRGADWSSDEEDHPPPVLSPPRSAFGKRIAQIGRTPVREAAARIGRDLVDAERLQLRHKLEALAEPSLSETATSPELSMQSKRAMGIESEQSLSMSNVPQSGSNTSASDAHPSIDEINRRFDFLQEQDRRPGNEVGDYLEETPGHRAFPNLRALPEDGNVDGMDSSFDDSFDEPDAAAFIMASANSRNFDDSFDGSDRSSDSLDGDDGQDGGPPIHAFAQPVMQYDDSFDDSFDVDNRGGNEEEPTIFGAQQARNMHGNPEQLNLLGRGLVDDTTAFNNRLRQNFNPETPTPWTGDVETM